MRPDGVNLPVTVSTVQDILLAIIGAPHDNKTNTIAVTRIAGFIFIISKLKSVFLTGSSILTLDFTLDFTRRSFKGGGGG
ncbi:hypothetical protein AR158_c516R [Paramecium bursaria Chlorella virus AR158]|uniref:hypothetical protein n=1 Tax=Paramecium bursaria Chlorella virus AR158 TaxID=380598 RepID=UPI00015AA732|nr:hypothetical protein AR158_c516R [Paramecium bursaria Chlorella virus AR158]ABU44061.1 hypothetical protein AR158_c516R [Paramecium bursaria Chlorella virus AR158]